MCTEMSYNLAVAKASVRTEKPGGVYAYALFPRNHCTLQASARTRWRCSPTPRPTCTATAMRGCRLVGLGCLHEQGTLHCASSTHDMLLGASHQVPLIVLHPVPWQELHAHLAVRSAEHSQPCRPGSDHMRWPPCRAISRAWWSMVSPWTKLVPTTASQVLRS